MRCWLLLSTRYLTTMRSVRETRCNRPTYLNQDTYAAAALKTKWEITTRLQRGLFLTSAMCLQELAFGACTVPVAENSGPPKSNAKEQGGRGATETSSPARPPTHCSFAGGGRRVEHLTYAHDKRTEHFNKVDPILRMHTTLRSPGTWGW